MPKKLPQNWYAYLGFLLLIPSLILNLFLFQKRSNEAILVLEVLDGDTLLLEGKTRLRLRHLDAPELNYCAGSEAKQFLESLVKGKKIIIREKILDQQARAMALVYLGRTLINEKVLASGWARYHADQTSQKSKLKKAAAYAKEAQLGLYSPKCYQKENLENPQCLIKGNIDKNKAQDNKKYYFPGCGNYKNTIVEKDLGEDWFCTEEEAQKAGFTKSKTCYEQIYIH